MSQDYDNILATDLLSDSRQKILNRDETVRTCFLGATEPPTMAAGQFWIDTTLNLIKLRNAANTAWYTIGLYNAELGHLPSAGGTFTGDLDSNGTAKVTSLPISTDPGDATEHGQLVQAKRNLLGNGGFEIWQRGASNNVTSSGDANTYGDLWQYSLGSSPNWTFSREATEKVSGSYGMKVLVTTLGGGTPIIYQRLLDNYLEYKGKKVTYSLSIKTNVADKIKLRISDGIGSSDSSYHTGGGGFERLTVTRTIDSGAITKLSFEIVIEATGTYYLDEAMAVQGDFSANGIDYKPLDPSEDWERCQRRYEIGAVVLAIYTTGATSFVYHPSFSSRKRAVPTITFVSPVYSNASGIGASGLSETGFSVFAIATATGFAQFISDYNAEI